MEAHRVTGELIAFAVHQHATGGQRGARMRVRSAVNDEHAGQPVGQRTADAVVERMDLGGERHCTRRCACRK